MPGASVRVLGIEVAQAIQNLDNRAPLIRGKDTVVRLYLQPTGFAKKQSIQGELAIAPSPGAPAQYVASANTIELGGSTASALKQQRGELKASLNFMLPADVLRWNAISIQVKRILSQGGEVPVVSGPELTLPLMEAPPLRVRAVGLRYKWTKPDGTTVDVSPEAFHFDFLKSFITRAYPVAELRWSQVVVQANPLFAPPFSGPTTDDGDDPLWRSKLDLAHNQLAAIRAKDIEGGVDPRTHYYGLVSDASAGLFFRGAAKDIPEAPDPSVVAVGPVGDPQQYGGLKWDRERSFAGWYGAHELAHTFGRFHPGFCNQDASDRDFPYADGRIGDNQHGDMVGLDMGDPALNLPMQVMKNDVCHDIMTYCDYQWVSSYSYQAILERLREEDIKFAPIA